MPPWGRPPQSQSESITPTTESAGAYSVFLYCLRADGWLVGAIMGIVYMAAYTIVALVYLNTNPILPWVRWYVAWIPESLRMLGLVLGVAWARTWSWFLVFLPVWITLWLVDVIKHARMLIRHRYRIEFLDRNWPPVYPQRDLATAGLTYDEMRARSLKGAPSMEEEPAPTWNVNAKLENGGKQTLYAQFPIPDAARWDWYRYCCDWQKQRKPKWSVGGFRGYKLNRDFYKDVTDAFEAVGAVVVTKSYSDGRQEHEPTAKGRAYLHAFSTTPPPEY